MALVDRYMMAGALTAPALSSHKRKCTALENQPSSVELTLGGGGGT